MKFASFRRPDGTASFGRVEGDRVIDLGTGDQPDLKSAIAADALAILRDGGQNHALADVVLLPVLLKNVLVGGLGWPTDLAAHLELMIVGALIVFFLIVEPHGLARLWSLAKEKLRLWPFPH